MIRIQRCVVRALVHDPLLAANRDALAEAVRRLVVDVVISRLHAELERVGAEPVLPAVTIRLTLADASVLAFAGPAVRSGDSLGSFTADLAVHQAVSRAVYDAHTRVVFEPGAPDTDRATTGDEQSPPPAAGPAGTADSGDPAEAAGAALRRALDRVPDLSEATARALVRAFRAGRLAAILALAGPAGTAVWTRLLLLPGDVPAPTVVTSPDVHTPARPGPLAGAEDGRPTPGSAARSGLTAADRAVAAVVGELGATVNVEALPVAAAVATAERLGLSPLDPTVREAVARRLGAPAEPGPTSTGWQPAGAVRQPSAPLTGEVSVTTVLPFLLLGPLARLGLLDGVAAALVAAGLGDDLPAFGAALARKVLPPPAHGWLHDAAVADTITAATGQRQPPDGTGSERIADRVPDWWPIVHADLVGEMVAGRSERSRLLLTPSAHGLAAADGDGVFPLLWDAPADQVPSLWTEFERPPVHVEPTLHGTIRIERAQPDPITVAPLAELVEELSARPASGRDRLAAALDGPLSVLAGTGLAVLAWDLWHDHEPTHPALALSRFADLDGTVTLATDHITVRMPLGRRHADLRDAGLLETVQEVPWLPGRLVEFTGG